MIFSFVALKLTGLERMTPPDGRANKRNPYARVHDFMATDVAGGHLKVTLMGPLMLNHVLALFAKGGAVVLFDVELRQWFNPVSQELEPRHILCLSSSKAFA